MEIEKEFRLKKRYELFDILIRISFATVREYIEIHEQCNKSIIDELIKNFKYYSKQSIINKLCNRISLMNELKYIFEIKTESDSDSDSDDDIKHQSLEILIQKLQEKYHIKI